MISLEELMSWLGRAVRLIPVVMLFVLASSCNNFFLSNNATESVSVTPTAILLEAGATTPDTYQLTANALTVGGTTNTVTSSATWSSSSDSVATVSTGGLVTAATGAAGNATATITATDGGQSGTATVLTYTGAPPTTISINLPSGVSSSVAADQTFTLIASPNGNSAINWAAYVSWASSDTSVATVNALGEVTVLSTAVAGDSFTITATANFGSASTTPTVTGTSTTFTVGGVI
jgi:hypothetical protein